MSASVKFWGTRGTIPTPGAQTARHGGNTACVEVRSGEHLVILDAGTGIRALGKRLVSNGSVLADLVLSHAHWDHIQGLPYFAPLFVPGNTVRVWGPRQGDMAMETILRQQMHAAVFPVPLDALSATLEVRHVEAAPIETPGCSISSMRVRHPANTMGYRLAVGDRRTLVYVTDDELGPAGDYEVGPKWRRRFVEFISGADLLIHDAMYTPAEYDSHAGWGHSTYVEAVQLAHEAGVSRLALFHHEPEHGDEQMDEIVARAREVAAKLGGPRDVFAAAEGTSVDL